MKRSTSSRKKTVVDAAWLARKERGAGIEHNSGETLLFRFARLAARLDATLEIRDAALEAVLDACDLRAPDDSAVWSWNIDVRLSGAKRAQPQK